LRLIDRREIEDYLAIHQALAHYSETKDLKPLNVAVFGPPGAGKTFGVTQVAEYISETSEAFAQRPLTYNLGQFTKLEDLTTALHLVSDECLSGRIPVVFFDEFDSAFDGRPFGWLKYFLAPMQEGVFLDGGHMYKLGQCVLVFAGGVNRSFEEMNGRLRNQSLMKACPRASSQHGRLEEVADRDQILEKPDGHLSTADLRGLQITLDRDRGPPSEHLGQDEMARIRDLVQEIARPTGHAG